jgi:hypothetical protein
LAIEEIEKSSISPDDTSSRKLFEHRKVYNDKDSQDVVGTALLDIVNNRQLYGKLNLERRLVYLSESKLALVNSADATQPIYLVDFVQQAFKNFRNYMRRAALTKRIDIDKSTLFRMQPVRGWISPHETYHEIMNIIYLSFYNEYLTKMGRNENILNFETFMVEFMNYAKSLSSEYDLPLTFSGFIMHSNYPPHSSGLIIDLHRADHNDDVSKNNLFLEDRHFDFYKENAKKFGFVVDKNAPWRLVADLSSSAMKKLMHTRGTNYNNFFKNYFYETIDYDVGILKQYIVGFYNSLVQTRPFVKKTEYCTAQKKTVSQVMERKTTSLEILENKYSSNYWLEKYVELRAAETRSKLNQQDMNRITKNIMIMSRKVDNRRIMLYIDDLIQKNSTINMNMFKQEDWQDFEYIPPAPNNFVAANVIKDNLLIGEDAASKILGVDLSFIDEALDDSSE